MSTETTRQLLLLRLEDAAAVRQLRLSRQPGRALLLLLLDDAAGVHQGGDNERMSATTCPLLLFRLDDAAGVLRLRLSVATSPTRSCSSSWRMRPACGNAATTEYIP
jgi:hypothetical protein